MTNAIVQLIQFLEPYVISSIQMLGYLMGWASVELAKNHFQLFSPVPRLELGVHSDLVIPALRN